MISRRSVSHQKCILSVVWLLTLLASALTDYDFPLSAEAREDSYEHQSQNVRELETLQSLLTAPDLTIEYKAPINLPADLTVRKRYDIGMYGCFSIGDGCYLTSDFGFYVYSTIFCYQQCKPLNAIFCEEQYCTVRCFAGLDNLDVIHQVMNSRQPEGMDANRESKYSLRQLMERHG